MMNSPRETETILIVDDDPHVLEVLYARLQSAGYTVLKAGNGQAALALLKSNKIDLMVSDMKMPGMGGMEVLARARTMQPGLPIVFLTAYGTIPDAVKAVKAGAVDYLAKPFDGKELVSKLREVLDRRPKVTDETDQSILKDMEATASPIMKKLYSMVQRVAQSNVNVLILGESGVGKERVAHLVHQLSPRSQKPFVVVDCGSTPAGLLESELFGHVKGAFTHAVSDKKGLIQSADKGTLFLDEIGNISSDMQVRLLRFLEDHKMNSRKMPWTAASSPPPIPTWSMKSKTAVFERTCTTGCGWSPYPCRVCASAGRTFPSWRIFLCRTMPGFTIPSHCSCLRKPLPTCQITHGRAMYVS